MTGRYEVLSKIAAGGMATVFAGRLHGANGFSKLVAIKCPHPYVLSDPDLAIQFEREAKLASQIHHPNVVSILDVAEINGSQALILEFVEGCTFSALLKGLDEVPTAMVTGMPAAAAASGKARTAAQAALRVKGLERIMYLLL